MQQNFKDTLKNENWALHFDGKKINKKEMQIIVLKNQLHEVRLAALTLTDGKALTIFNGITGVLDQYQLWESIKIIICDTTSVNTGGNNGVVVMLQRKFKEKGIPVAQYIGCQHHVLDLVLKHVMNQIFGGKTTSPNISYDFIHEIIDNYEKLKIDYQQSNAKLKVKNIKWRDDMQFLYELGNAYKYFQENGIFPFIKFKKIT